MAKKAWDTGTMKYDVCGPTGAGEFSFVKQDARGVYYDCMYIPRAALVHFFGEEAVKRLEEAD